MRENLITIVDPDAEPSDFDTCLAKFLLACVRRSLNGEGADDCPEASKEETSSNGV